MAVKKNDPALKAGATAIKEDVHGAADPAPTAVLEEASGAIIEPTITNTVDMRHESVDANPREGTTAAQNAIDWNDPKRVRPDEADFTGQGVDPAVYGEVAD
ncbi:hypothetical protein H5395_17285 [Paracoccus sp. MC1854]|uniref:hypothetical protein n=1 Tax=Paracoccus sp. MC1854 TaxID=2760306 RepID=UPI0016030C82|nr:hypothetical protein [Paracoccus sp. MC1854]MBB1493212.1 hypothetical protein [Paracoccus sp. MC1854]